MTTLFVSRHAGALQWAQHQGIHVDQQLQHLQTQTIEKGDTVIGTLPINLVAEVNQRGGRYLHLSLDVPQALRGQELSADDMQACCPAGRIPCRAGEG